MATAVPGTEEAPTCCSLMERTALMKEVLTFRMLVKQERGGLKGVVCQGLLTTHTPLGNNSGPGWVAQLFGVLFSTLKGRGFDSWSGHIPRLWVQSPVGERMGGTQSMCLTLTFFSLPSSLSKINKHILKWEGKNATTLPPPRTILAKKLVNSKRPF